jgi:hypothetical protein
MQIIGAEKTLGLSCDFFFGMSTPLILVKVNRPSLHDLILLTQQLHRVLGIGQIGLERCDIIDNDISGCLQVFLELRDMEHIMYTHQGWWQLQFVSHGSKLLQNRKQTNVARSKLAFDPKPLHTSHG